jgi:hypothetical protein
VGVGGVVSGASCVCVWVAGAWSGAWNDMPGADTLTCTCSRGGKGVEACCGRSARRHSSYSAAPTIGPCERSARHSLRERHSSYSAPPTIGPRSPHDRATTHGSVCAPFGDHATRRDVELALRSHAAGEHAHTPHHSLSVQGQPLHNSTLSRATVR